MKKRLPKNYFDIPEHLEELKQLILNPNIRMKAIEIKYSFSRVRLYKIIRQYNLPYKFKDKNKRYTVKYSSYYIDKLVSLQNN